MTYAQIHTDPSPVQSALRTARDRSARGNATRRDWERVAEIDPNVAHRELRDFLRRAANATYDPANPYVRQSRIPGASIGFLLGVLGVAISWIIMLELQEVWADRPILRDIATGGQFLAAVLIPIGIALGARWSRREAEANGERYQMIVPQDATFDELLDIFERTQNSNRARVY
jgi:hypothetical protein